MVVAHDPGASNHVVGAASDQTVLGNSLADAKVKANSDDVICLAHTSNILQFGSDKIRKIFTINVLGSLVQYSPQKRHTNNPQRSAKNQSKTGAPRTKAKQKRQEPKQNRSAKNQSKGARKNKAKRKQAEPSTTTSAQQQTSETTSPRHTSHIAKRHIKTEVILTS
jgi:hypothetical protein